MPETYNATGLVYNESDTTYDGDAYGPLPFPIVGVYIAFNDGPYVANPAWTEITNYVRAISTRRGRSDDFEQFDTGTAQLVLDNRDRRFDPFYTSGPYYLKLTPRRQIRIVGQANGVNYDIFRGFVAGWPVTWTDAGYDSTVTIQAFDALGLMAGEVVPTDWPYTYTTSLNPGHYWRFDEAQPVAAIEDEIAGWNLTQIPAFSPIKAFENPTLGVGLTAGSLFCPYWGFGPSSSDYFGPITFTGWVQLSDYNEFPFRSGINFKDGYQTISIGQNGNDLSVTYYSATGTTERYTVYDVPAAFGSITTPFHFAAVLIPLAGTYGTHRLYINGSQITLPTPTTSSSFAGFTPSGSITAVYAAAQELTAYRRTVSAAEIQNLYDFGSGRIFETTSARMSRLVGTTEWPSTLTSFTSTPAASVSEIGTGNGVVPEMQLVADSEGGDLYVSKAGVLTMTNRTDVFNAPRSSTPQATITDSGAGLGYGTELQIDYDADSLSNDVTVTFSGNGEVNAFSDAVIEAYGAAATTIETQLADPTSASQLATRQLGVQGSLVPRISPLDLSVNTSQSDWQTILGLELLDRVTFKRTPTVGNQFSREALVNAIEHTIEPGSWATSVQLSMRYTSPLVLNDDVLGTLDFNYLG